MAQNRNKLIDLFIGNIANTVLHKILEEAINNREIANKYEKESTTSYEIAKKYREKINPLHSPFPDKDIEYVKTRIINKVRAELLLRISNGYENINLNSVEKFVDELLSDMKVI